MIQFLFCGSVIVCRNGHRYSGQRNYNVIILFSLLQIAFDSLASHTERTMFAFWLLAIYRIPKEKNKKTKNKTNKTDFIILWLFCENRSSCFKCTSTHTQPHTHTLLFILIVVWSKDLQHFGYVCF